MVYRLVHQRSVLPLACGLLALILSFAVQPVGVAQAGTLTVNANDGPLSAGDSYCTLREAIAEANDTVAPGTYTECGAATFGGEDTIEINVDTTLGSALPVVFSQIIINGNGHFVDGADTFRVLDVSTGAVLTINNLTLMNGRSTGGSGLRIRNGATVTVQNNSVITGNTGTGSLWGSGIHVDASTFNVYDSVISYNATISGTADDGGALGALNGATVTIERTTFDNNSACDDGGAIHTRNSPTINITDSTFTNNQSGTCSSGASPGGAIATSGGTYTIRRSTFSDNTNSASAGSTEGGGAVRVDGGTVTIYNSTFSGNSGGPDGGGGLLVDSGTVTVYNSTIVENSASANGGGVDADGGTLTLVNTIVGNNGSTDCTGTIATDANNLFVTGAGCTIGASDVSVASAGALMLGGLGNNGGPTQTILPAPDSPAVDAGDNATCEDLDQRGYTRARTALDACDIGSVELQETEEPIEPESDSGEGEPNFELAIEGQAIVTGPRTIDWAFTVCEISGNGTHDLTLRADIDPALEVTGAESGGTIDGNTVWYGLGSLPGNTCTTRTTHSQLPASAGVATAAIHAKLTAYSGKSLRQAAPDALYCATGSVASVADTVCTGMTVSAPLDLPETLPATGGHPVPNQVAVWLAILLGGISAAMLAAQLSRKRTGCA